MESTEKFISTGTGVDDIERRYIRCLNNLFSLIFRFNITSERDAERDPSLLYSPSMAGVSQPSLFVSSPIHQSTPEHSISINQFGYDLHEVQTHG